jgi:hypothetical protein
LSDASFYLLSELISIILQESESKADFKPPRMIMPLAATFYHNVGGLPEFIHVSYLAVVILIDI